MKEEEEEKEAGGRNKKTWILKVTAAQSNITARRGVAALAAYYVESRDLVPSVLFDAN